MLSKWQDMTFYDVIDGLKYKSISDIINLIFHWIIDFM